MIDIREVVFIIVVVQLLLDVVTDHVSIVVLINGGNVIDVIRHLPQLNRGGDLVRLVI